MKMYFARNVLLAVLLTMHGISTADILPPPEKISEHVYAWIGPYGAPNIQNKGFRMNLVFVVGKDAVAVLDSGYYPAMAEEMVKHIRQVSKAPIKYVINSNSQPHRMLGNDVFRKVGAEIIATEPEVKRMQENANTYVMMLENAMQFKAKDIQIPDKPNRIIDKPLLLNLGGGVKIHIEMYKAAHTPLPLIIHVPGDNIVYAGDVLYSGRLLSLVTGSNMREWIETYAYLKKFTNATFIPGHGRPAPLSEFDKPTLSYLQMLDAHMRQALKDGTDMQDAINGLDQSAYSYLENFDELAGRNANLAYQEAERAAFE